MHTLEPEEARALRAKTAHITAAEPEPVGGVADTTFEGPGGSIDVRIYDALDEKRRTSGSLVYFHGGGWVMGDLDTHDAVCRGLCNASGLRVVAVDYRRAPESAHPSALEDAYAATRWVAEQERGPLVVGGDSAGGHLATCVAARARDGGPPLAAQVLIYPVTDLSSFDTPSYHAYAEGFWLTRDAMAWFRDHLVPAGSDLAHPDVSPLKRSDLSGMPPAVLVTAECDVLRDEALAYADRLVEAGCPVTRLAYGGVIHGFVAMPGTIRAGRQALDDMGQALRRILEGSE